MRAITTKSSIKVNPVRNLPLPRAGVLISNGVNPLRLYMIITLLSYKEFQKYNNIICFLSCESMKKVMDLAIPNGTVTQLRVTSVTKEDEAGLSLSKLVSKLEAGSPTRQRRVLIGTQRCWVEFPGRASIRASTTLNVRLTKVMDYHSLFIFLVFASYLRTPQTL